MKPIQVITHYYEIKALFSALDRTPVTGSDVGTLLTASILDEMKPKLIRKIYSWENAGKEKKHRITLTNHEARAIAIYSSRAIGSDLIKDNYDKSCIDMLRLKLMQKLA